ncbi:hypothetical protein AB0J81_12280 [Streptomyces bobili]
MDLLGQLFGVTAMTISRAKQEVRALLEAHGHHINTSTGTWHAPFAIAPAGSAKPGALTAVSRFPEHLDVFWVGPDGGIGTTYWTAG